MKNGTKMGSNMAYLWFGRVTRLSNLNKVCLKVVGTNVFQMQENSESWDEGCRF